MSDHNKKRRIEWLRKLLRYYEQDVDRPYKTETSRRIDCVQYLLQSEIDDRA